ncbi:hypothetical protein [Thermomonospora cellulosilytica]|uniref:Uncharacterized protein n=1 Tax=Thermomonospora cellulosilytica TaxID=1411118 RepID=A0A7W3MUC0_9ACTN|nr:hypothetical protein [Thermomonospora cellulosilytica]MBA9001998.1 hypothetical protein [Thermomonospora cellulosilytica]
MTQADDTGWTALPRELWRDVLAALDSDDRDFRHRVYGEVLALAPPAWDADLPSEDPPGWGPIPPKIPPTP